MKKSTIIAALLIANVAGCDISNYVDTNIPVAFAPGFEIEVDGQPVNVVGRDQCPDQMYIRSGCLVVTPESETVHVQVNMQGTLADEIWVVEVLDKPFRFSMSRDGGKPVILISEAGRS